VFNDRFFAGNLNKRIARDWWIPAIVVTIDTQATQYCAIEPSAQPNLYNGNVYLLIGKRESMTP
jgi:hypothetical protein